MRCRKLAVIACSLLLASAMGLQSAGYVVTAASSESQLEDQLSDLENQKSEIDKAIAELEQDITKKEQLKEQLQRQISNTQEQISICNQEIESLSDEISRLEADIEAKNVQLEENKEAFKQRVRAMYMSGGTNDLEILLGADNFADYLSRSELSRSVSERDQDLMEEIAAAISEIEANQAEVEAKQEERTEAKKTLAAKQKDLKDQMSEVEALLDDLGDQQEELNEDSESAEAAMDDVQKQLNAAREAARQAAEEQKPQQSSSSSSGPSGSDAGSSDTGSSGSDSTDSSDSGSSGSSDSGGMSSGLFLWPVSGSYTITSPFGYRIHPIYGTSKFHKGVDIAGGGVNGKPIVAVESGTVYLAGYNAGGYGNYVIVGHGTLSDGNSYETLYAHMSSYVVSSGQYVEKGQVIGYVGSTGASTGPHLHFEVHRNGSLTDPMDYYNSIG